MPTKERTSLEAMEHKAREIAGAIGAAVGQTGDDVGFLLFLFNYGENGYLYGEGGNLTFISSAGREDAVATVVEWLGRLAPEVLEQAIERWKAQGILGPGAERGQ